MRRVQVVTNRPYEVVIDEGILETPVPYFEPFRGRPLFLLTDETVEGLYADGLYKKLYEAGFAVSRLVVPPGEGSKSLHTLSLVLEAMAEQTLHRDTVLLALGGGIVGDLGGFCAAVYLRGIDYIQIPTTLLAAVDSSVGGKTAVNLRAGKNLAGAFHQPVLVLLDPAVLATLPPDRWTDGVAETVKCGILFDRNLFERTARGLTAAAPDLADIIATAVDWKARVVAADERDHGRRQLLNLGHTFGHAIEQVSGFTVSHGRAVAMGTAMMARACARRGLCTGDTAEAIEAALLANGLPVRTELSLDELFAAAQGDKKADSTTINLVVIESIGQCRLHPVKLTELKSWLEDTL